MTTYESDIKTISKNQEVVFNLLSDLSNLQKLQDINIQGQEQVTEKLKEMEFDRDSINFNVSGFGKMGLRVIEREPLKTIKFAGENTPVAANLWIQLKETAENETHIKLTLKAEIPMMIKMMVDKKLKEGINLMADAIAKGIQAVK